MSSVYSRQRDTNWLGNFMDLFFSEGTEKEKTVVNSRWVRVEIRR